MTKRLAVIFLLLLMPVANAAAETGLPYAKEIGAIKLNVPADPQVRKQLGITAKDGQFTIGQIKSGLLIIEVFNMYCPHCQHYAPTVNDLYKTILADANLRERVMLIGIGVGNSPFEVDIFRKKYAVAFPLFDDKGYAVYNTFQSVLTPHFIGLVLDGKGGYRMFYSKNGGFEDAKAFLNTMIKLSGLPLGGVK